MKPIMPKPSPQLVLSACASVFALAALALSAPTMHGGGIKAGSPVGAIAGIEMPSIPALPALLPIS